MHLLYPGVSGMWDIACHEGARDVYSFSLSQEPVMHWKRKSRFSFPYAICFVSCLLTQLGAAGRIHDDMFHSDTLCFCLHGWQMFQSIKSNWAYVSLEGQCQLSKMSVLQLKALLFLSLFRHINFLVVLRFYYKTNWQVDKLEEYIIWLRYIKL